MLQTTRDSIVNERALAGCIIACNNGAKEVFDGCIMAANAPSTLKMLGKEATCDETRTLGDFQYVDRIWIPCEGLKAGVVAADGMLRRNSGILELDNPKHMVPIWPETGARLIVTRFFRSYIQTGCIISGGWWTPLLFTAALSSTKYLFRHVSN
ncbi:hypothetical protein RDI58_024946 [Solanum bulbocastanum]|uniref:Uncharacterized protein n=1 Tax=Solanum bulbocastanum TaxID=147425 RepID=A0AAN8Y646_SOLBU